MLKLWAGREGSALRLGPRSQIGVFLYVIGAAHFFSRCFDAAAQKLFLRIQELPRASQPYRYLAACYAQVGRSTKRGCGRLPQS